MLAELDWAVLAELDGPPDFTVGLVGLDALASDSNGRADALVDFEEGKSISIPSSTTIMKAKTQKAVAVKKVNTGLR